METPTKQTLCETRKETHDVHIANGDWNLYMHISLLLSYFPNICADKNVKFDTFKDKLRFTIKCPNNTLTKLRDFIYLENTIPDKDLLSLAKTLNCRSLIDYCEIYLKKVESITKILLEKNQSEIEKMLQGITSVDITSLLIPFSEVDYTSSNDIAISMASLYIKLITRGKNVSQNETIYLYGKNDFIFKNSNTSCTISPNLKGYTKSSLENEFPAFKGLDFNKIFEKVKDCEFDIYSLIHSSEIKTYLDNYNVISKFK